MNTSNDRQQRDEIDEAGIVKYITETFPDVETDDNYGYKFFFYASDHKLPFATIASSDNQYESESQLDRPGVFRLNIGVSKTTFQSLFGKDAVEAGGYDFTVLDIFLPHPHYSKITSYAC